MEIEVGQSFTVRYPFVRSTYQYFDEDGPSESPTWKPGTRNVQYGEDCEAVADGMGEMTLTVVSTHKPGKYPMRVFCTRRFRDPDGREFGKGKLHIMTAEKFSRLSRRFGYDYRLVTT